MSSYINFYLRINDTFAPIGSYSRSSEMYQEFSNWIPYEKIRALTSNDLSEAISHFEEQARRLRDAKENDKKRCEMIMQANNPLSEKMDAIYEIESSYDEIDESINELQFAADTLRVFWNMVDDYKYYHKFDNDADHYIYAGVEASGDMESIEE